MRRLLTRRQLPFRLTHSSPQRFCLTTMPEDPAARSDAWDIAYRWCQRKGAGWQLVDQLGVGGTAPVFELTTPDGPRALKVYDPKFSTGQLGDIEHDRIQQQLRLRNHNCRSLVQVYDGGFTDDRLFLLMSRAPGTELEKRLRDVPRSKIRVILHEVAQACLFLESRDLCHRDVKAANVFVSDDFNQATLLDISVIRGIHDPVGVGTDHGGQLPVLATARYSPPEYLFRLIAPGPSLWHALTIYQLGALLHDLIARTPLFQVEYQNSKENRYRFAWVVATRLPEILATDIDDDLLFLAHRALDKDWHRRARLRIEDFLQDSATRQRHALQTLGMFRDPLPQSRLDVQARRLRLDQVSTALEEHLVGYFRKGAVRTTHSVSPDPSSDDSRTIALMWDVATDDKSIATITLQLTLCLLLDISGGRFAGTAVLAKRTTDGIKEVTLELPDTPNDKNTEATLAGHSEAAVANLAAELSSDGTSTS